MSETSGVDAARRAADPSASPQELAELAAGHPELWALIAVHPQAYDGLRQWIAARQAEASTSPQLSAVGAGGGDGAIPVAGEQATSAGAPRRGGGGRGRIRRHWLACLLGLTTVVALAVIGVLVWQRMQPPLLRVGDGYAVLLSQDEALAITGSTKQDQSDSTGIQSQTLSQWRKANAQWAKNTGTFDPARCESAYLDDLLNPSTDKPGGAGWTTDRAALSNLLPDFYLESRVFTTVAAARGYLASYRKTLSGCATFRITANDGTVTTGGYDLRAHATIGDEDMEKVEYVEGGADSADGHSDDAELFLVRKSNLVVEIWATADPDTLPSDQRDALVDAQLNKIEHWVDGRVTTKE